MASPFANQAAFRFGVCFTMSYVVAKLTCCASDVFVKTATKLNSAAQDNFDQAPSIGCANRTIHVCRYESSPENARASVVPPSKCDT